MKHLTTVCFLFAALLMAQPALAVAPTFNGNTINATNPVVNAAWYGVKCNGSNDDTTAAQNAINAAAVTGSSKTATYVLFPGGTCQYSSTLTVSSPNIIIEGQGGDRGHDVGTNCTSSTIFKWTGGSSATILQIAPISGSGKQNLHGAGVENICFTSNTTNKATHALSVLSTSDGVFQDLFADDTFGGSKFYFGTVSTLGEYTDDQHNLLLNLACQGKDDAVDCLYLDGGGSPAGNFSMNTVINLAYVYHNGNGITCNNADNNLFLNVQGFNASSGTGDGVDLKANCFSNTFIRLTPGGTTLAETGSAHNTIEKLDVGGNNSPLPTIQSNAFLTYSDDIGHLYDNRYVHMAIGGATSEADSAFSRIDTSAGLWVYNGSADHMVLDDGTNKWGININGSTGLRFNLLAGSGSVSTNQSFSATGTISAGSHLVCSSSSGVPCEGQVTCSLSSATTCSGTLTVPASSNCVVSANGGADTTTGAETLKASLSSTTLTVTALVSASQTSTVSVNVNCL